MEAKVVSFSKEELTLLAHRLTPSEVSMRTEGSFLPPDVPSKELCLKIGSALLQAMESNGEVEIAINEHEGWALRERVSPFEQVATLPVGLSITKKLFGLLLEFDGERLMDIEDMATSDHEEQRAEEVRHALEARDCSRESADKGATKNDTRY